MESYHVLLFLFGSIAGDYIIPEPQVKFFRGSGFQLSIPVDPKISVMGLKIVQGEQEWDHIVLTPTDDLFALVDMRGEFKVRDLLLYHVQVIYDNRFYERSGVARVKGKGIRHSSLHSTYDNLSPLRI